VILKNILTRSDREKWEEKLLASYAVKSNASRGRAHPEEEHPYRSVFQRDRDRIIHSTAFRRLEYKTQVFIYHEGDYYRTRLTHTIEVAQISGCIARALGLNEDLCEAIALAHDLGHTPFGHAGEKALNELMKDEGGFEHNRHGLRVVDKLEERYPDFAGLNLSWEVREGIIKHVTSYDSPSPSEFEPERMPSLEAQVVNVADEIAYNSHDLDDGLTANLLSENSLEDVELWREVRGDVARQKASLDRKHRKYQIIRRLIDFQATDVLEMTLSRLDGTGISSVEDVRSRREAVVSFSPSMQKKNEGLKEFLLENMYLHYRVVRMTEKAERFIKQLFNAYLSCPGQLPPGTQVRLKTESPQRVVCDYVAGMTDRFALDEYKKLFALDEYKKLFEPYEKV
jgi:dGTPase